jgi:hypothetical protein
VETGGIIALWCEQVKQMKRIARLAEGRDENSRGLPLARCPLLMFTLIVHFRWGKLESMLC